MCHRRNRRCCQSTMYAPAAPLATPDTRRPLQPDRALPQPENVMPKTKNAESAENDAKGSSPSESGRLCSPSADGAVGASPPLLGLAKTTVQILQKNLK